MELIHSHTHVTIRPYTHVYSNLRIYHLSMPVCLQDYSARKHLDQENASSPRNNTKPSSMMHASLYGGMSADSPRKTSQIPGNSVSVASPRMSDMPSGLSSWHSKVGGPDGPETPGRARHPNSDMNRSTSEFAAPMTPKNISMPTLTSGGIMTPRTFARTGAGSTPTQTAGKSSISTPRSVVTTSGTVNIAPKNYANTVNTGPKPSVTAADLLGKKISSQSPVIGSVSGGQSPPPGNSVSSSPYMFGDNSSSRAQVQAAARRPVPSLALHEINRIGGSVVGAAASQQAPYTPRGTPSRDAPQQLQHESQTPQQEDRSLQQTWVRVCMHVCLCLFVCVSKCVYWYSCAFAYARVCLRTCMLVCVCTCARIHVRVFVRFCVLEPCEFCVCICPGVGSSSALLYVMIVSDMTYAML
jgi:hypothetical protein